MKFSLTNNFGLKLLALVLAIIVYYTLKTDSRSTPLHDNDRILQK